MKKVLCSLMVAVVLAVGALSLAAPALKAQSPARLAQMLWSDGPSRLVKLVQTPAQMLWSD